MSIVKSAQPQDVGSCDGGLPKATFERLEPYVGEPTSTVHMGLGSGNGLWLPDHGVDTADGARFQLEVKTRSSRCRMFMPNENRSRLQYSKIDD
jgi:hypothetical protein